jgi:hypothetical protein
VNIFRLSWQTVRSNFHCMLYMADSLQEGKTLGMRE